jgi:hypothetical protein
MGITNITNQQASQPYTKTNGRSRGIAMPMDGTPRTFPQPAEPMVTLDLDKYNSLLNPAPRKAAKPKPTKAARGKAVQRAKPWFIRVFERIRWTVGPKY